MTLYEEIEKSIQDQIRHPEETKGDFIKKLELSKKNNIKAIDTAYPTGWADAVRDHFGIRNIGNWGWAYTEDNMAFGFPIPCDQRSMALFDAMVGQRVELINPEQYGIDTETFIYAKPEKT